MTNKQDWTKDWTAEVVARMHTSRITGKELADRCNYTDAYLSTVLNSDLKVLEAKPKTRDIIFKALDELEDEHAGKKVS